jgi:hypothetical protein
MAAVSFLPDKPRSATRTLLVSMELSVSNSSQNEVFNIEQPAFRRPSHPYLGVPKKRSVIRD